MALHRTGRTVTLYLLFIIFSAAWLSTVFVYYGSFAPTNNRRHHVQGSPQLDTDIRQQAIQDQDDRQLGNDQTQSDGKSVLIEPVQSEERPKSNNFNVPQTIDKLTEPVAAINRPQVPPDVPLKNVESKGSIQESTTLQKGEVSSLVTTALHSPEPTANSHTALSSASNTFKRSTTTIMILACKRPHYLEQTLNSLMRLEGVGEYKIVISQDGDHQGVHELANSFISRFRNIRLDTRRLPLFDTKNFSSFVSCRN